MNNPRLTGSSVWSKIHAASGSATLALLLAAFSCGVAGCGADAETAAGTSGQAHPYAVPAATGSVRQALSGHTYSGTAVCQVPDGAGPRNRPLAQLPIFIDGIGVATTDSLGRFQVLGGIDVTSVVIGAYYDGPITESPAGPSTPLQIMDDGHATREERVTGTVVSKTGHTAELGAVVFTSVDCDHWLNASEVLHDYHSAVGKSPQAGKLRIKRLGAVYDGIPYAFYDYIVMPTTIAAAYWSKDIDGRVQLLMHEFGHTIRHAADGDSTHWTNDAVRYRYARIHSGDEVTEQQYAFNEGWAEFWTLSPDCSFYGTCIAAENLHWNERLISAHLISESRKPGVGRNVMLEVLQRNPGAIHSLYEFKVKLASYLGWPAPAAPPACPPGYSDDGATCRKGTVVAKPSYGRGTGSPPTGCAAGQELDAGLCYAKCTAGYRGAGPVCWQVCPVGYSDDGATCRLDAQVISADNSACPWYDKCGVTLAKGCSRCPAGFRNDGCTCRRDPHVFAKSSYGRGTGVVPSTCTGILQYDAGLCYPLCSAGYTGVGPVCWGQCPSGGYEDHGATCFLPTAIITK